jgi:hypothetical protein
MPSRYDAEEDAARPPNVTSPAAAIYSLIETAKLNGLSGVDRQAYTARRYSLHAVSQSAPNQRRGR